MSKETNLSIWLHVVMASRSFILGLLPGLKSMVWFVTSICLRAATGPDGQPDAMSFHASSSRNPCCIPRGKRGRRMLCEDYPFPVVSKKG